MSSQRRQWPMRRATGPFQGKRRPHRERSAREPSSCSSRAWLRNVEVVEVVWESGSYHCTTMAEYRPVKLVRWGGFEPPSQIGQRRASRSSQNHSPRDCEERCTVPFPFAPEFSGMAASQRAGCSHESGTPYRASVFLASLHSPPAAYSDNQSVSLADGSWRSRRDSNPCHQVDSLACSPLHHETWALGRTLTRTLARSQRRRVAPHSCRPPQTARAAATGG